MQMSYCNTLWVIKTGAWRIIVWVGAVFLALVLCSCQKQPDWLRQLLWAKDFPDVMISVSIDHTGTSGGPDGRGRLIIECRRMNLNPDARGVWGAWFAYKDWEEFEGAYEIDLEIKKTAYGYLLHEKLGKRTWMIDVQGAKISPAQAEKGQAKHAKPEGKTGSGLGGVLPK
jgi:hypothetical protein